LLQKQKPTQMLQDKIIGIHCLIDDILKGIGRSEHNERKVSDSEIMLPL
jgi:hypothetical protein